MNPENFKLVPWQKGYEIGHFDCGITVLNNYIKKYASQDIKRYLTAVYLCIEKSHNHVAGYYTLSSHYIDASMLDNSYTAKLPNYPYLPSVLIGRLAVDKNYHGNGLGKLLLMYALEHIHRSGIGTFAVLVESKNDNSTNFYGNYGFIQLKNTNKLFLPMKTIAKLF